MDVQIHSCSSTTKSFNVIATNTLYGDNNYEYTSFAIDISKNGTAIYSQSVDVVRNPSSVSGYSIENCSYNIPLENQGQIQPTAIANFSYHDLLLVQIPSLNESVFLNSEISIKETATANGEGEHKVLIQEVAFFCQNDERYVYVTKLFSAIHTGDIRTLFNFYSIYTPNPNDSHEHQNIYDDYPETAELGEHDLAELMERSSTDYLHATVICRNPSEMCVICQEFLVDTAKKEEESVIRLISCGHIFHKRCLVGWMRHKQSCPLCRQELQ